MPTLSVADPYAAQRQAARTAGYSDDEINGYLSSQSPKKAAPAKKVNKRSSWLSALPSVAAAGASLIPGVGTAGAALIGGGGELARQLISGEGVSLGKIGTEAVLSAVPGGLGKIGKTVLKGVRGAKVATKSAKAAKETATATEAAPSSTQATSLLSKVKGRMAANTEDPGLIATATQKAGEKLRATNRGIQGGDKIGKELIDDKRATELNTVISDANKGLIGKTVRGQVRGVQQAKKTAGAELDAAATASKGIATPESKARLVKSISTDRDKILTFDPANKAHVDLNNRYAKRLDAASTPKEILDARRTFGQAAQKVYANPDATQTLDKELAAVYYKHANKLLDKVAPEVRAADKKFSTLTDAEKALTSSKSKVDASGVKPFGTSINGKGIGGGTLQAATDTAGKLLESAGGNAPVARYVRGLTGQVATRAIAAPLLSEGETPVDPNAALEGEVLSPDAASAALSSPEAQQPVSAAPNPATVNAALQVALLDALGKGDYQGISAIKTVMDVFASQQESKEKPLTASQATRAVAAKNALNDIPLIEEAIESGKLGGAKSLPGSGTQIGRRVLGTENLDAALFNIADNILRARSGAAAPEAEVKRFVDTFLPAPSDSKKAKTDKLARAIRELQGYVNPNSAGEDTLEGLIASQ